MRLSIVLLAPLIALTACATVERPDPLEGMNRGVFAFNEKADQYLLKPTAQAYVAITPAPVRTGLTNFYANVSDVWSAANLALQGRPRDGLSDLTRTALNSTIGVLGLFDVATSMGFTRHGEDLGQTLGRWGLGPGAYLVLPILGPSSLRDVVGLPIDLAAVPQSFVESVALRNSLTVLGAVNQRASMLGAINLADEISLDKYLLFREAYLQRRRSLVYDGEPPDIEPSGEPAGEKP